ncbi:fusaric acid cluster transcription factor FUB10 [Colletotrichum liriopes]|uniref:Fusaric acid cluster transcription factor FUB10 n=1 Tax=Colletotrichum liriopes TaxID=708192 RepID=A0AA37GMK8_9PEZI|nr:fusaric acid cluster transcription factor FUB10 [Colletotrichum liriopes]
MTSTAHPNQRRSACERCRRQKLRCSRQDTDENRCSRCAKLGVECVAGQQRRIGRPLLATATGRAKPATQSEDSQIISLDDAATVGTAPSTGNESHARPTVDLDLRDEPSTASTTVTAHDASAFNPDVTIGALFDDIPWGDGMALETHPSVSFANLEAQAGLVETHHRSAWIPARPPGIDPVVQHEALVKLSKLNLDLHSHLAKIAIDKERIDFCSFAHPASPLALAVSP